MTLQGKTYSLYGSDTETDQYYSIIRKLTNLFLTRCPDEKGTAHADTKSQ